MCSSNDDTKAGGEYRTRARQEALAMSDTRVRMLAKRFGEIAQCLEVDTCRPRPRICQSLAFAPYP